MLCSAVNWVSLVPAGKELSVCACSPTAECLAAKRGALQNGIRSTPNQKLGLIRAAVVVVVVDAVVYVMFFLW